MAVLLSQSGLYVLSEQLLVVVSLVRLRALLPHLVGACVLEIEALLDVFHDSRKLSLWLKVHEFELEG